MFDKKNKVDKHYNLINARYKLSSVEQKLVLSIISLIRPTDSDFMNYQIPLSNFSFLNENGNSSRLKKYCKELMSKPLEIETVEGWTIFNWFSHLQYRKNDSMLECSISPRLKPYLLELKNNYKTYNLKYILEMNSEYSIRLYELLKKNELCKFLKISLEDLFDLFQVPDSFKRYDNFKRKILQFCSIEIAKLTDIYYEFEEIKDGKKVTFIKFNIFTNRQNLINDDSFDFDNFRDEMKILYEGKNIFYHEKLERTVMIKNGLLTITESGTIIKSERAKELWLFLFNNKNLILELK